MQSLAVANLPLGISMRRNTTAAAAMKGTTLLENGRLLANGTPVLTMVPLNISSSPHSGGTFLGATSTQSKSRQVFELGVLDGLRFMCCFRFKLWWMSQFMGKYGSDVPSETQFLLVECGNEAYTVLLPLLDGSFRSSLQGNKNNVLELCIESGDPDVQTYQVSKAIYAYTSSNPYEAISDAMRIVQSHMGTFKLRVDKKLPDMLDWFGWCTWDAFYTDVSPAGIERGLTSLCAGGVPPRFVIIDDGWQSIAKDEEESGAELVTKGTQYASRLIDIRENIKFRGETSGSSPGLQAVVHEMKASYNVKYVYMWHAMLGYWGGLKPGYYGAKLTYPQTSPGVIANDPVFAHDSLVVHGLGLPDPTTAFTFYDDLHGHLASCGVDGVKVDAQSILETLGAGYGGRVELTRKYHEALESSISKHFPDNGCISCMSHNADSLYSSKQTALARASDDFWPDDPSSHAVHVAAVAYNSLFMGEVMHPDWDMFQSAHPAAEYHAAARAVGGCSVYVSDKPGVHDLEILRKLVFPDGSVLRAALPGRPTRDCLFSDPLRDGSSLLKIWNMNKHNGVLGVFNCQGEGWCKENTSARLQNDVLETEITGTIKATDVELLENIAPDHWNGDAILYSHRGGKLVKLRKSDCLIVTLNKLEYEVFTIVPFSSFVNNVNDTVAFAAIGFLAMLNSGGCIKNLKQFMKGVKVDVYGCGVFGAYASGKPQLCTVDGFETQFSYDNNNGMVLLTLEKSVRCWHLEFVLVI